MKSREGGQVSGQKPRNPSHEKWYLRCPTTAARDGGTEHVCRVCINHVGYMLGICMWAEGGGRKEGQGHELDQKEQNATIISWGFNEWARVCMRVSMCVCVCMCMCTHMPVSSCSACSCSQSWKSCLLKTWTWEGCYRGLCMAESSPWFLLLLIPLFLSALPAPVIFLVSGELHLTFISVQIYRQLITFFGWKYCYLAFFWKTASWTKSFRVTISFFPSVRGCFSLDCWLWYLMNHLPLLSLSSLMCNELTIPSPFLDAYNIFLFILGAQQRHQDCLGMVFLCLFCLEFAEFLESLDLDPI